MKWDGRLCGIKVERIHYLPFHLSPNLRLVYVLEGSIKLRWVSGEHVLDKGEIEILNINEPVMIEQTESDNLLLIFEFNGKIAKEYCSMIDRGIFNCNTTLFYSSVTAPRDQEGLKQKLELIYHYYFIEDCADLIEKTVEELVLFICDKCHDLKNMFRNVLADDVREERFLRIYTYILENCHKKINLKELAEGEYLSPQYLSKEFNDRLKINFKDTLEYFRVIQAVRYLISSSMSVMQISERCGFSAPRYLYKHFEHYMHCTPAKFRTNYLCRREEIISLPTNYSRVEEILHTCQVNGVGSSLRDQKVEENTQLLKLLKNWEQSSRFTGEQVPEKVLEELLDIAFSAPSFGKAAELQVIPISASRWKEKLKWNWLDQEFAKSGAAGFLFCVEHTEKEPLEETLAKTAAATAAAWQFCIAARAKGLGVRITSNLLKHMDKMGKYWSLPDHMDPVMMVAVGYPYNLNKEEMI